MSEPRLLPDAERLPDLPTPRLVLRALGPDDVPALLAIFGDPEVCRYWSRPPLPDLDAAAALQAEVARHFAERTLFQWGIVERAGGRVVGTCTLAALSPEHRRAEVGYALAREVWGRGYAAEALPALVAFAFTALGLHRLEADVDPRNAPSLRSLERLGFAREGHLRERWFQQGEWQDAALYGLLRADWEARARADRRRG
jgi:RimJ/RimL family protein N-acetyltransferase